MAPCGTSAFLTWTPEIRGCVSALKSVRGSCILMSTLITTWASPLQTHGEFGELESRPIAKPMSHTAYESPVWYSTSCFFILFCFFIYFSLLLRGSMFCNSTVSFPLFIVRRRWDFYVHRSSARKVAFCSRRRFQC